MKKKQIVAIVALLLIVAIAITGYYLMQRKGADYGGDFYKDKDSAESKMVRLMIGTRQMQDAMGEESMYPEFYLQVKTHMINGEEEDKAIQETKESLVERIALFHHATKQGYKATEKETNHYVNSVLHAMKKSEDYSRLNKLYEQNGTTMEKEYRANNRKNVRDATIKKWENHLSDSGNSSKLTEETESVTDAYEKTESCASLEKSLRKCEKAFKEYGSNGEKVKEMYGNGIDWIE